MKSREELLREFADNPEGLATYAYQLQEQIALRQQELAQREKELARQ